jgi:hypothetical protein
MHGVAIVTAVVVVATLIVVIITAVPVAATLSVSARYARQRNGRQQQY